MMRVNKITTDAGFTLLELLVALLLFSIISGLLYSGLSFSMKSLSAAEKRSYEVNHVLAIQAFMRSKVATIRLINSNPLDGEAAFKGQQHQLEFVSDVPQSVTSGGLAFYQISLNDNSQKPALQVSLANYPKDDTLQEDIAIEGISEFTLMYFGKRVGEQENTWHEQWQEKNHLPLLVKIEMGTPAGLNWPAQVVAIRAAN
jgi:general secretion pathway protein J